MASLCKQHELYRGMGVCAMGVCAMGVCKYEYASVECAYMTYMTMPNKFRSFCQQFFMRKWSDQL